jgi:hypothetical protein
VPSVFFVVCLELLRAFFEGRGVALQMRENFTGEMKRAGDQDRIWPARTRSSASPTEGVME